VQVGRVGRPHGLDGAFVVERGSEDESRYAVGSVLYVDGVRASGARDDRRIVLEIAD